MNLIVLEPGEVDDAGRVRLAGARAEHLRRVLRVEAGQTIRVGLLDGPIGVGEVQSVSADRVDLQCAFAPAIADRPRVDLLLALPRPKVLRRLWAQLAALGIGQIILTAAERVERNYFDTHVLEPACYRPLLIEGLQQARDTRLPRVSVHRRFNVLIEEEIDRLFAGGCRLAADPAAERAPGDAIRAAAPARVLLAIGPEGGWNGFERDRLAAHGFQAVGMGPRTLRTDTACIALLALVHNALK